MTTILFAFLVAFILSLALTPGAKWLGVRLGAVDVPTARKVHTRAIPRIGGLAIVLACLLGLASCLPLGTEVSNLLVWDQKQAFAVLGAIVAFTVGFADDFRRLGPRVKFLAQILAASLAFYGGVRIDVVVIGEMDIQLGVLSWLVTVFWFLLLINAVNLIDGLDGLAAGVAFFTSTVMVVLAIMQDNYLTALEFAVLAGALLGFLRYNFNPASVFMGDGGSYCIGYTIAALSIMGSIKSQMGATILIPLLALGVPIFDTVLSPLRRWIRGRRMFGPDKGHIHHRLLAIGFSSRRAVLLLYGVSCGLCLLAILLVNLRNETASLILVVLGTGAFIIVRKLGYMEYLAVDKISGWFRDLSDEAGISRSRRSFLSLQIEMDHAGNLDDLWGHICQALEMMRFDRGELHIHHVLDDGDSVGRISGGASDGAAPPDGHERRRRAAKGRNSSIWTHETRSDLDSVRVWARGYHRRREDTLDQGLLRIEIPIDGGIPDAAKLILIKNLTQDPFQPYTLRRVEYLRRSVVNAMHRLHPGLAKHSPAAGQKRK